jgi:hypothetical protein
MESIPTTPPSPEAIAKYHKWWDGLSDTWKQAFNEVYQQKSDTETPPNDILHAIWTTVNFRMAGPSAMFPNMTVELEDLSGVKDLDNIELLVVTNHHITGLQEIAHMTQLNSLFVFSNKLSSIEGVENLKNLISFYFNDNQVESLLPLAGLRQLETINCVKNKINSFEGIGTQHKALKDFFCLPNEGIWQSAIMQFENEVRIQCKKG